MITEDYVSFETAKLLKEKGFVCKKESITAMYGEDGEFYSLSTADPYHFNWGDFDENDYIVPTLQMAMKWLRKVHHLEIYPFHEALQEFNNWWFRIERHSKGCSLDEYESELEYNEYEDACEAAIKYCLENLI